MVVASDMIVEAFTHLAPTYGSAFDRELKAVWGLGYRDLVARLVGSISIGSSDVILDVGTGTAQIPVTVATQSEPGSISIGLDITPAMLRCGRANVSANGVGSRVRLVCASAMNMPFAAGHVDSVICGFAMHHLDVPRMLAETRRVLREGGQLVLACVAAPALLRTRVAASLAAAMASACRAAGASARIQAEIASIANIRTAREWHSALAHSGFECIQTVAEFPGRRRWYPGAVLIKARKGRRPTSAGYWAD